MTAKIVKSPGDFLAALASLDLRPSAPSVPHGVLLVMPEQFRVNAESAVDNLYMNTLTPADPDRALAQARGLATAIARLEDIELSTFPGDTASPDGVFPNNVFATVPGRLIVGRMLHPGRQREARRQDIRSFFLRRLAYSMVDLSGQDCVAELTGPLILDRARAIGYCGMTGRVDEAGLNAMVDAFKLKLTFRFDLAQGEYHTNVVMMVLASRACVIYPGSFVDPDVPEAIARVYPDRSLFLDDAEKNAFAGNCIALTEDDLFMSRTGADALRPSSLQAIESWGFNLHTVELDEIEKAGGSLRCMVAEIF